MNNISFHNFLSKMHVVCDDERSMLGISDDSRKVAYQELFVCIFNDQSVEKYIEEALEKGAVVVTNYEINKKNVYYCKDLLIYYNSLCDWYYGNFCKDLYIIGITGTNGKTSCACLIEQLFKMNKKDVLTIGTHFVRYKNKEIPTKNTTLGMYELAYYFYIAKQAGCRIVIMEVSSHAIVQNRILNICFNQIIYTNISEDHLDYHKNKKAYVETKLSLVNYLKKDGVILYNSDDVVLRKISSMQGFTTFSYGVQARDYRISDIEIKRFITSFKINGYGVTTKLLGDKNVYNVCAAIACLTIYGQDVLEILHALAKIEPIKGRMQVVYDQEFTVLLDYAHTIKAIEQLIKFSQKIRVGRIIMVCGCGGNRDHSKRKTIGLMVAKNVDFAIFTSDNPRDESIKDILHEMLPTKHDNVILIENRRCAIKHAITIAKNSDIIIIAGKGSEKTMEIKGVEIPFDDQKVILELLE